MTPFPVFVLDANVFIEAARRYYAFDIVPAFWKTLVNEASSGRVISVDRIKMEIDRGNDELALWANRSFHQWFASTAENDVIDAYRQIMTWANGQSQFTDAAKAEFANGADGWLIAYAKAKGCDVVTHEQFDAAVRARIKIPNVCQASDVQCVDTFEMLRTLGVRFG